jgi:HAD superfamily hydrolase (TIGR01490 family)
MGARPGIAFPPQFAHSAADMTPVTLISVFDLDRTLTRLPTYTLFLLRSALRNNPLRLLLLPALIPVALLNAAKILTRRQMKMAMHAVLLGRRIPAATATSLADTFARHVHARGLLPAAVRRIGREQAEGRRVILATAAPELYARPLAALLGIDDVVATRCTWQDGDLLATIQGENCYGPAKREMLDAYLAAHGLPRETVHIRFFSDHASDLPMFDWVDEPIAVNPSAALTAIAKARGWPQFDWTSSKVRANA